jgi:hypothetical protein
VRERRSGCDLSAELLRPEECAAAEAATHVEHLVAERNPRLPDMGCMAKQTFLRDYDTFAKFGTEISNDSGSSTIPV